MKRLAAPLLALSLLPMTLLAACEAKKDPAEPVSAAPDAKPGTLATDGMLLLPVVKGRPAAAYFNLTNSGDKPVVLAAVSVEGAEKAELHETKGGTMAPLGQLEVKPGEAVRFERGGKHVMIFGLSDKVTAGGSAEMTLTFADGDKISAPLMVESMADMGAGMDDEGHGEHR